MIQAKAGFERWATGYSAFEGEIRVARSGSAGSGGGKDSSVNKRSEILDVDGTLMATVYHFRS